MKSASTIAILAAFILVVIAIASSLFSREAVAAPAAVGEQYFVLSIARGQTDAQLAAQLNTLGADGWRLRCSIPNGLIFAR